MSSVECLREFVNERLTAAAEEIFTVLTKTVVEYEEEIDRQRKLLDIAWKPVIKLHRIDLPQQHVCKQEEVLAEQQLCIQERNSSLDQEDPDPPQIKEEQEELCSSQEGEQLVLKQETETFTLTPIHEESDHSEDQTQYLDPSVKSSVVSEPNSDQQLLSQNSQVAEIQDQNGGKHGDSGSTGDAEPKPKNQKQYLNPDDTLSAAETESVVNIPVQSSVVSEPNSDHQLLSHCSPAAESQDQKEGKHGDSGSTGDAEPKPKKRHRKTKSHSNNVNKLNLSEIHHNTHTGKKSLKCDTCGKDFEFRSTLQRHLRSHTGEKPFLCKTCGRRFGKTSDLKNHTRIHTGEKPMQDAETEPKNHHHKSKSQTTIVKTFTISENHCDTQGGKTSFNCDTCGKTYRFKSHFTIHLRSHTGEKPFSCNTCGKSFSHMSGLKIHIRIHTGETPYLCQTCGKGFRSSGAMLIHARTHTGEKPYLCNTCGKKFFEKAILKKHMTVHTGEKPYLCQTCGKGFRSRSAMLIHARTHTGEKPYLCNTCGKGFRQNHGLTCHIRRVHTGERPYLCKICGKRYFDSSKLIRHTKLHTGK